MQNTKKIYLVILLLPILDVFTSIITKYYDIFITPGIIVKGILMLISIIYILISKSKYTFLSRMLCFIFLIYSFLYFISKPECLSSEYIFTELIYLFKLFYFPVMFLGLLCYFNQRKFNHNDILKLLNNTLLAYVILLTVPVILGSANNTYVYGLKGTIGWFYSGNEISCITVILFASILYLIENKKLFQLLIVLVALVILFNIGTKVGYLGLIITAVLLLLYGLIKNIKINNSKIFEIIIFVIVFTTVMLFSTKSASIENTRYLLENQISEEQILNPIDIEDKHAQEISDIKELTKDFYNKNQINMLFRALLSNRDTYLASTISIYNDDNSSSKILYGIGFSNTSEVQNKNIAKLIEIDILDAFFHYGVIGLFIMISPFLITLYLVVTSKSKITLKSIYYILVVLMACGISTLAGHTLMAPSVVIYLILYLLLILDEYKILKH